MEIEQSVMARQALSRRIPDQEAIKQRTTVGQKQRNESEATVDWQFTPEEVRIELGQPHPKIDD